MNNKKWTDKIKNLSENSKDNLGSENETEKTGINDTEEIFLIDEEKPNIIIRKFDKEVRTDEIDVPNEFIDLLLGIKTGKNSTKVSLMEMPIAAMNILFRTIALVKSKQFNATKRPLQLELFEEEYKTKQNAKVSVVINIKDLSFNVRADGKVKGRREKVREAIDFLQYNLFVWVIGKNSHGKTTDYKQSFIESPSFTNGIVCFDMNVFWLEKLINLKVYNTTLLQLPQLLKNTRHVLFSLYLERFERNQWKPWNYKKINEIFELNYSDANSLAKGFFREVRHKLDKNSLRSFQYRVKGENILIYPYEMKNIVAKNEIQLETKTLEKLDENHFANYVSRRHGLSKEKKQSILDVIKMSNLDKNTLKNAYNEFKRFCRSKEIKVSVIEYQGDEFLNKWNTYIFEEYKKSQRYKDYPNGYPRI